MAAKCDITRLALEQLGKLYWGTDCENNNCQIVDHYLDYLNCSTVDHLQPKGTKGCISAVELFNCNMNVLRATLAITGSVLTFTFIIGDIVGGKLPYSYKWTFDEEDFSLSSPVNEDTLVLTLKQGKKLDVLVSKIIIEVTDSEGCFDNKIGYLVNGQMIWYNNYTACPNINSLIIRSQYTQCAGASGLIIKRKI